MAVLRHALTALVLVGAAACGQPSRDRPPPVAACSGSDCVQPLVSGGPSTLDAGTSPSTGVAVNLTGRVLWFEDDQFAGAVQFPARATITADAQSGGTVSVNYDGVSDFLLPGVLRAPNVWVSTAPVPSDAMTTLLPIDTEAFSDLSIPLVRPSAIDLALSVLSQPAARDFGRAQVVLYITSAATGFPIQGVTVTAAEAPIVAYADNGTWTDTISFTGRTGLTLLGNVTASGLPGAPINVNFTGARIATMKVRVASGAATVVRVAL